MIHSFEYCLKHVGQVGTVTEVNDFLVKVEGLTNAKIAEGVTFENELHGRVLSIAKGEALVLILSRETITQGMKAARTGAPLSISVGEGLLGHMIDTLGHSLTDRRKKSREPQKRAVEAYPVGISDRRRISTFFETGVAVVDLLIPIGLGQRELIIGDRKIGKTHFLLQVMLSQARLGTICIYCAIGKNKSETKAVDDFLAKNQILNTCVIVAADSYASPGEIYLAPYTAMTLAEYFRDLGRDVLVILDDLTTHAKYYREIGLLAEQLPGRESYPADIFHVQAKLLERAGNFLIHSNDKNSKRETSITCLPVAETIGGDISGYIQTNIMSMTDGHLYFDTEEYVSGRRPPINIFLSVTRVGRQTQPLLFQTLGIELVKLLKQYEYTKRFLRFETELSNQARQILTRGRDLMDFFEQIGNFLIPSSVQAFVVALIYLGRYDKVKTKDFVSLYGKNSSFKKELDHMVSEAKTVKEFSQKVLEIHEKL